MEVTALRNIERPVKRTLFRALPDLVGFKAVAEQKPQSIEDDRFAGARLAGEHVRALIELQTQLFDQDEILDALPISRSIKRLPT